MHLLNTKTYRRGPTFGIKKTGLFLMGMIVAQAHAAVTVSPGEMEQKRQWVRRHLLTAAELPPFSFTYGGQPSSQVLPHWRRVEKDTVLDRNRTQHETTWTNEVLQVRCLAVEYRDYPVVEWTVYLKNIGTSASPILQDIKGMDTRLSRKQGPEFVLHCNKGDSSTKDSYEPYLVPLNPSSTNDFAPTHVELGDLSGTLPFASGKSCDGPRGWPYYNLQMPGGGVILAIGWPGQWSSSFSRDSSVGLRIQAGQQLTHLYLKPGEEIRTPLIAILFWRGVDVMRAQNMWRHWYIADNEPRIDGAPQPFTAQGLSTDLPALGRMLAAGIKLDNFWRDAEDNGGRTWWLSETGPYHVPKPGERTPPALKDATAWWNTGTWDVDPAKYPRGFKPISDWCHEHGMTFMLWFEPERVGNPNSWLAKNHPEWLLPPTGATYGVHPSFDPILDEGNPAALHWLIEHTDGMINSQGIDIYREDMNGAGPCPAWRKNDSTDRQGITENFYVQGHLAFWDELRRRHPHLRIDSCASGGRRNDLESMRRGVSIGNRSDFMVDQPDLVEGNQGHTYGLSSWLPYQGGASDLPGSYACRSFYLTSFGVEKADLAGQVKAYADWRMMVPYLLGDYYPLTPYTLQRDRWIAWQFDRPDLHGGEVQAFCHPDCIEKSMRVRLHGLEASANYEVTNLDGGRQMRTGRELMGTGLEITAAASPAAVILIYKRVTAHTPTS